MSYNVIIHTQHIPIMSYHVHTCPPYHIPSVLRSCLNAAIWHPSRNPCLAAAEHQPSSSQIKVSEARCPQGLSTKCILKLMKWPVPSMIIIDHPCTPKNIQNTSNIIQQHPKTSKNHHLHPLPAASGASGLVFVFEDLAGPVQGERGHRFLPSLPTKCTLLLIPCDFLDQDKLAFGERIL